MSKLMKKVSISVATLALFCPLAMGAFRTNASRVSRATAIRRDERILNTKTGCYYMGVYKNLLNLEYPSRKSGHRHGHKYYKGYFYNRHEYYKYLQTQREFRVRVNRAVRRLGHGRSQNYRRGIIDAFSISFTRSLKHNKSYRAGYIRTLVAYHIMRTNYNNHRSARRVADHYYNTAAKGQGYDPLGDAVYNDYRFRAGLAHRGTL